MVTVEDKLVAAKNEENSRIAAETALPAGPGSNNPTVIEQQLPDETSKIVYSDGVYFFLSHASDLCTPIMMKTFLCQTRVSD